MTITSGEDLTKLNEGCVLAARPDAKLPKVRSRSLPFSYFVNRFWAHRHGTSNVYISPASTIQSNYFKHHFWRYAIYFLKHRTIGSIFWRPAIVNSCTVSRIGNSVFSGDMPPKSAVRCSFGHPTIIRLMPSLYPCTIMRRVSEIVLQALYGEMICIAKLFGPLEKRLKGFPFIAYQYALCPVVRITFVLASLVHSFPNSIKARTRLPMGSVTLQQFLSKVVPATFRLSCAQIVSGWSCFLSARASTIPKQFAHCLAAHSVATTAKDSKIAKLHPSQVYRLFSHARTVNQMYGGFNGSGQ